jgi:hypothetical protein
VPCFDVLLPNVRANRGVSDRVGIHKHVVRVTTDQHPRAVNPIPSNDNEVVNRPLVGSARARHAVLVRTLDVDPIVVEYVRIRLDARMWCERVSAAAGNVMSTGVEGEVEEEQRQH